MSNGYIGAFQVDDGNEMLIGSTLYGICNTDADVAAKVVILPEFDSFYNGITIRVKFINGNILGSNVSLQVGTTNACIITGNAVCQPNEIVSFTYESSGLTWRSNSISGNAMPVTGGTFLGNVTLNNDPVGSLDAATKQYVDNATAGLTGAMHWRGTLTSLPDEHSAITFSRYEYGDVIRVGYREYVYHKTQYAATSFWMELGDEDSYARKNSTRSISAITEWDSGSPIELGDPIAADEITSWNAGGASNAVVENGVLRLTNSQAPQLGRIRKSIPNVINAGAMPTLTATPITVVVP